jgi:hypothetical protein
MFRRQLPLLPAALVFLAIVPTALEAQRPWRAPKGAIGITGTLARPVGEFRQFVSWGGGLGLYGLINFDRGRHVGLRIDGTVVIYGHERFTTPLSSTVRRVLVDVTTSNNILRLGAGPQITLGSGAVRPYIYGTAGFSYFHTVSSVGGSSDFYEFASTTNFDDFTPSLTGGGGLLLRLSRGRHPVSLDLSAETIYNGEAEYLRRGGIVENRDGSITLLPIRSEANLVTVRVGISVGV